MSEAAESFPSEYPNGGRRNGYVREDITGWAVFFEKADWPDSLKQQIHDLLERRLNALTIPEKHGQFLRQSTRIFCDVSRYPENTPATYHSTGTGKWLLCNCEPQYKERSINITDAVWFLRHAGDGGYFPDTILHEVCHAFHDRALPHGYGNQAVRDDFVRAKALNVFECEYAYRNEMEYFAAASVSFWGVNHYEPRTGADLQRLDPKCYDLLSVLWS